MSRFDEGRWARILIWTGAALTWASALVASRTTPVATGDPGPAPETDQVETVTTRPDLPTPPAPGLVVLRYTPVERPLPEVRTVRLERPTVAVTASPPAPVSEGS
jgi:hypothetical protein